MKPIKSILCPVDFSSCSEAALDYAIYLAQILDAKLKVLHVYWTVPSYAGIDPSAVFVSGDESLPAYTERMAERDLAAMLKHRDTPSRQPILRELQAGEPTDVILEVARNDHTDLIVIGTHGRGGLSRMLMGSVAEKIVRSAVCPVLTLHGTEKQS
ncbi:MAG: universal stress protein [Myxococcota bacterium]